MNSIQIERVTTIDQCIACREILASTWGPEDTCSIAQMMVHASYGGVLLLAKKDEENIGCLLSFPAIYREKSVLWSHVTAVLSPYAHQGVGFQLKLEQRRIASEMGYKHIVWTFDPLVSLNAHFNLNKLGATIAEYKVNIYGVLRNDPLNRELPTDRFVAIWTTEDREMRPKAEQTRLFDYLVLLDVENGGKPLWYIQPGVELPATVITRIPRDMSDLLSDRSEVAMLWRIRFREIAERLFGMNYKVKEFISSAKNSAYIWERNEGAK